MAEKKKEAKSKSSSSKPTAKVKKTSIKKTKKEVPQTISIKFNRNMLATLVTIIVIVGVAAFSFFLAFSLRNDIGASIPSDYSRYIGRDYVIGFPRGWEVNTNSIGGFSATDIESDTNESEGSITVDYISLRSSVGEGFEDYNEESCEFVRNFLAEQQQIQLGEEYLESSSSMIELNGQTACDIQTQENRLIGGSEFIVNTRYLILEKDGVDESYLVVGFWKEGEEIEAEVSTALRTFEIIEEAKVDGNEEEGDEDTSTDETLEEQTIEESEPTDEENVESEE